MRRPDPQLHAKPPTLRQPGDPEPMSRRSELHPRCSRLHHNLKPPVCECPARYNTHHAVPAREQLCGSGSAVLLRAAAARIPAVRWRTCIIGHGLLQIAAPLGGVAEGEVPLSKDPQGIQDGFAGGGVFPRGRSRGECRSAITRSVD